MKLGSANKICICWVILGELESFRIYKGFSNIFPKILDAITYYASYNFLIPLSITFLNLKSLLGFPFFYEQ